SDVVLSGAQLEGARLVGADLSRADLTYANCYAADFRFARLVGVRAVRADFRSAKWVGADRTDGDFAEAQFESGSLGRAWRWVRKNIWAVVEDAARVGTSATAAATGGRLVDHIWPRGRLQSPLPDGVRAAKAEFSARRFREW